MMINDDFMLKALFILKIFKFCLDLFGHEGKRLDEKSNNTPYCLRSKYNQTIKLGELIEYNMSNIFL